MKGRRSSTTASDCRRVALHADDLGMNRAVTDGIFRAFSHGLLTSTSLLANAPDAARAMTRWSELARAQQAAELPSSPQRRQLGDPVQPFDLGIHWNLTQGRPLTASRYPAELLDSQGRFPGLFVLFRRLQCGGSRFRAALVEELSRQTQFILDHGVRPTHLNGHQYIELFPAVARLLPTLLEKFHIRVVRVAREPSLWQSLCGRDLGPRGKLFAAAQQIYAGPFRRRVDRAGIAHPDAYFGVALAGRIEMRWIRAFLKQSFATAEICLHPADTATASVHDTVDDGASGWYDPLADLRPKELEMLVSAELAEYLMFQGVKLGRLGELTGAEK
jgi:predicted glycoside hydrolase/deacetylase ChbG (UPF0249 family)